MKGRLRSGERRELRRFALVLFIGVYALGFLLWLALGRPPSVLRRVGGAEVALIYVPAGFAVLLLYDILIERRDARREAAQDRKE